MLVPRPRVNLVRYHGLLAPRAAWRAEVIPRGAPGAPPAPQVEEPASSVTPRPSVRGASWADLMRRAFEASATARRILTHLALPAEVPTPAPARAPPIGHDDVSPRSSRPATRVVLIPCVFAARSRRRCAQTARRVGVERSSAAAAWPRGAANGRVPRPTSTLGWVAPGLITEILSSPDPANVAYRPVGVVAWSDWRDIVRTLGQRSALAAS